MKILLNIIWLIFGGLMVAVEYFASSIALLVTIVGIPFALQTFKLGILALWPFGTDIHSDGFPLRMSGRYNECDMVVCGRYSNSIDPFILGDCFMYNCYRYSMGT